jgi:hypothetical protein
MLRIMTLMRRVAVLVGWAPHERPVGADERAARSALGYSPIGERECRAVTREAPENFLRAYLAGAYDSNGDGDDN